MNVFLDLDLYKTKYFTKVVFQFTFVPRMFECIYRINLGPQLQTKDPSKGPESRSWRLHSCEGWPHHTTGLLHRRLWGCHEAKPPQYTCWVWTVADVGNCRPLKMYSVHQPPPPVSLFCIKLLIRYIYGLLVYNPSAKELGKMSFVFFLKQQDS